MQTFSELCQIRIYIKSITVQAEFLILSYLFYSPEGGGVLLCKLSCQIISLYLIYYSLVNNDERVTQKHAYTEKRKQKTLHPSA